MYDGCVVLILSYTDEAGVWEGPHCEAKRMFTALPKSFLIGKTAVSTGSVFHKDTTLSSKFSSGMFEALV